MPLGKNIKYLREQRGWTLEKLAEESGVELGTISALEVRDSTRSKYASPLAAALGVPLELLLREELPVYNVGEGETFVREPAPNYHSPPVAETATPPLSDWPFRRIPLERILMLNDSDLAFLEGKLDSILESLESAGTKKSSPRRRRA